MRAKRTKRKQFLLSEELAELLRDVSTAKGVSENELVNKALSYYLSRYAKDETKKS